MQDSVLSSPRPATRQRCDKVPTGTPSKKQRREVGSSSSSAIVRAPSPVGSSPSVQDDEHFEVDGPECDGDEEGREVRVVITRPNKEERINDLTGVKKQVDWYKVVIGDVSNNICVDPVDGVKVWATYGKPTEGAYKNIDDLLENLLNFEPVCVNF